MKTYKFLQLACVVALMGAATGCADDALVQSNEQQESAKGQPVTLQVSMPSGESRIAFNEGGSKMALAWEEGDTLKVIGATNEITKFELTEGAGTAQGTFEGTPATAYSNAETLHTLYHNQLVDSQIDSDGNITLRLNEQDGTLNDDYLLLYGKTSYAEGQGMKPVELKSLVTILKLSIPTDKTLTQVTLGRNEFRSKATLVVRNNPSNTTNNFQAGELVYCYADDNYEQNDLIKATGRFEPKDGVVTVYFYILPAKRYWENEEGWEDRNITFSFTAIDEEGKEYINAKEFGSRGLEQGKMYRIQSGIFSCVDFENEATANGSKEKPYEIATKEQLYTFMMRCSKYQCNNRGEEYGYLNYKLTADIAIDNSLFWNDFNFYGTFDGDGHQVSGSITRPFISWLHGATVCNLVLDLDYVDQPIQHGSYGLLAEATYHSTIKNVVNHSSISVSTYDLGGLVGAMLDGSVMQGCANTGNLTSTSDVVTTMGGLVGRVCDGSKIEACYNTGNLTAASASYEQNSYFGGLVGYMDQYEENGEMVYNGILTSCWTSGTLNIGSGFFPMVNDIIGAGVFATCLKVEDVPTVEEIERMNATLLEKGSFYSFDAEGKPVNNEKEMGSTSGPDIPFGGIY